ncbi:MAG: tRNA/rRNA methyltransferase SpoU [Candidatus Saccharibacteria bacterium]|nr:tRNA/rRNA methyltransferase SpoU [Candidatus Saccharibacteria bacterium]
MQPDELDTRNVTDEFKGMSVEAIKAELDTRRYPVEIAIENLERDFNAGTIVRNANAFNVRAVHIVGRRQWNKRGAMATDHYMNVYYHPTIQEFILATAGKHIIGIDNIEGSVPLHSFTYPENAVLVFGSEGPGLSQQMIETCEAIVAIEQFGSTRSVNVGVASGIALYSWFQQFAL